MIPLKDYILEKHSSDKWNQIKSILKERAKNIKLNLDFSDVFVTYNNVGALYDIVENKVFIEKEILDYHLKKDTSFFIDILLHELAHKEYCERLENHLPYKENKDKYVNFKNTLNYLKKNNIEYVFSEDENRFRCIKGKISNLKSLRYSVLKDLIESDFIDPNFLFFSFTEVISFATEGLSKNDYDFLENWDFDFVKMYYCLFYPNNEKVYLFKDLKANKILLNIYAKTQNIKRAIKESKKLIYLDNLNEIVGKTTMKEINKSFI